MPCAGILGTIATNPLIAIKTCNMALTVGGIRQTMQKHDSTDRLSLRLKHKGTIEILRKVPRIDRTALKIPIGRHTIGRIELPGYLALDVVEDPGLSRQIFRPIGRIKLLPAQFMRNMGVPGFEWQSPLRIIDADGKQRQQGHAEQCTGDFHKSVYFRPHDRNSPTAMMP